MEKGNIYKRILMMLIGNVILGMGAGMLRAADFGVDPYQCFVLGIDKVLKLGYGTTFVIVNAVFLVNPSSPDVILLSLVANWNEFKISLSVG